MENEVTFCCGGDDKCAGGCECQCHSLMAECARWERMATTPYFGDPLNESIKLLQRWLGIFEAAGAPVASGDPQDNPVLSVMGDTRTWLRDRRSNDGTD